MAGLHKSLNAFSLMRTGFQALGVASVGSFVKDSITYASEVAESMNLFSVSMGGASKAENSYYQQAKQHQADLHNSLLLNQFEFSKYQGAYFNILKSQMSGAEDLAFRISKNLTSMTVDMSSLYNTEFNQMSEKLQSAITGQVKALRSNGIGIDISEKSLQSTLDLLGIDQTISKMNYAEKEVVRYISIFQQASQAQGDFARTMDSPANALKLLETNFAQLRATFGAFFTGALASAAKYIIAIIQLIQEALTAIAELFGLDVSFNAFEVGAEELGKTDKAIEGIGNGMDKATKKAKKFRLQLLSFDEINNITGTDANGGTSGVGGGTTRPRKHK